MPEDNDQLLLVDAGGLSDIRVTDETVENMDIQYELMDMLGYAAINVSPRDLDVLPQLRYLPKSPLISANLRRQEERVAVSPWRVVEKNGLRIGITGAYMADDARYGEPLEALRAAMAEMKGVDVRVALADSCTEENLEALKRIGADIVVANLDRNLNWLAVSEARSGDDWPLLLFPARRGASFTALRLNMENGGHVRERILTPLPQGSSEDGDVLGLIDQRVSEQIRRRNPNYVDTEKNMRMTPEEFLKQEGGIQ